VILKAVIVAAGLSSRLYPLTKNRPKALLAVGSETLIERSIRLLRLAGIADIAVVTGFRADSIRDALGDKVEYVANPFYRACNNMASLWMARHFAGDDAFVYLHGDLVFTKRMISGFVAAANMSSASIDLLTAFGPVDGEAMKVRVDGRNRLIESSKSVPDADAAGEWTGIAAIHRAAPLYAEIERYLMDISLTEYDTAAFTGLAARGEEIVCLPTSGEAWKEIDTIDDLESARAEFQARE
jgi:choline kinase